MTRGSTGRAGVTRRDFLRWSGAGLLGVGVVATASQPASALSINPRSSWATNRPPKGPLDSEDVRFLLIHHSASRNGHTGADAPGILRSFYDFHTGPEKGWNDIAYNFLIDSDGGVWEGRSGSIAGAVAGDATGGNQGFSQLVCVIGDYNLAQPSAASLSSLVSLLAWMADKHRIPTSSGSTVTFTSRGSNKWPQGSSVTTPTINGHRAMSSTTCPGDNLFSYVSGGLMADVTSVRSGEPARPDSSTTSAPSTTAPTTTTSNPPTTTTTQALTTTSGDAVPSTSSTLPAVSSSVPTSSSSSAPAASPTTTLPIAGPDLATPPQSPLLWTGGGLAVLTTAALAWRYRRMSD